MIDKVAEGFYVGSDKIKGVYYVLSVSTQKIIYSHMTALYFHNLSIKAPDNSFDITVTKKYNNLKHVKYSIKEYLKRKDRDLIKLSKYVDIFGIKEEVMDFVSMMYE